MIYQSHTLTRVCTLFESTIVARGYSISITKINIMYYKKDYHTIKKYGLNHKLNFIAINAAKYGLNYRIS